MRKGLKMRIFHVCIVVFFAVSTNAFAADTLVLNTADEYPLSTEDGRGYEDLIIKEAFQRSGVRVQIVHLPSERALVNANTGINDGNFVRIAGIEHIYPNLVRVREKITEFEFAAFTKDRSVAIRDWNSLKPYSVGIITGWKILEANVLNTRSLTKVGDPEALFELLARGRADVVIFDRTQGNAVIRKMGFAGVRPLTPLLARQDMYLYLNRRHATLAAVIARTLREMKGDGSFDRIVNSVMRGKE